MSTTDFDRDFALLDELDADARAPIIKVKVQRTSREQLLQHLNVDPDLVEVLYPTEEQDLAAPTIAPQEDDLPFTCCPVCNKDNLTRDDISARCTCSAWFLPEDTAVGVPEARRLPRKLFEQIPKR